MKIKLNEMNSFPAIDELSRQLKENAFLPMTSFSGNPYLRYYPPGGALTQLIKPEVFPKGKLLKLHVCFEDPSESDLFKKNHYFSFLLKILYFLRNLPIFERKGEQMKV